MPGMLPNQMLAAILNAGPQQDWGAPPMPDRGSFGGGRFGVTPSTLAFDPRSIFNAPPTPPVSFTNPGVPPPALPPVMPPSNGGFSSPTAAQMPMQAQRPQANAWAPQQSQNPWAPSQRQPRMDPNMYGVPAAPRAAAPAPDMTNYNQQGGGGSRDMLMHGYKPRMMRPNSPY